MKLSNLTEFQIDEIESRAEDAARIFGGQWDSALIQQSPGNNVHGITSEHTESVIVRTDDDSLHSSWLCDYLESVSPAVVLELIKAARAGLVVEKQQQKEISRCPPLPTAPEDPE